MSVFLPTFKILLPVHRTLNQPSRFVLDTLSVYLEICLGLPWVATRIGRSMRDKCRELLRARAAGRLHLSGANAGRKGHGKPDS